MIVPLFIDQLLLTLVGIADTFIVSYAGEAALSGVSLVNAFSTVLIHLFTALASGGAVIVSQYIGRKLQKKAGEAASQLLLISIISSVMVSVLILLVHRPLLRLLFGSVEPAVMDACIIYLLISAYSYPAVAIYNSGSALYRSMGKTNVPMFISLVSNVINIIGNVIGVFILHAGVAGVAYPTLVARVFSAIVVTLLCFRAKHEVYYRMKWVLKWDRDLLKKIAGIAIPNGLESAVHQLVKVALSSFVALFGTYQIAANGVAQSIWSLAALMGLAMGPAFTTVIAQCMGAGEIDAATYYFKKLLKITFLLSLMWNGLILALTPLFLHFYALSDETKHLIFLLVLINNIFNIMTFPFAGPLGNGLRAAGDVKFTTAVSMFLTVAARLAFSAFFCFVLDLQVFGIAWGIALDLTIRAIIFVKRFQSGKWKHFKVI